MTSTNSLSEAIREALRCSDPQACPGCQDRAVDRVVAAVTAWISSQQEKVAEALWHQASVDGEASVLGLSERLLDYLASIALAALTQEES